MDEHTSFKAEVLLRTRAGRFMLVFVLVVVVSLITSVRGLELAELRGSERSSFSIFLEQFIAWAAWGIVAWPTLALASWLLFKARSWLIFLLVMSPVSIGVSYGFLYLDHVLRNELTGDRRDPGRPRFRDQRQGPPVEPGLDQRPDPGTGRRRRNPDSAERTGDRPRRQWRQFRAGPEPPSWDSPYWRARWMQELLLFWVILGMGGGLNAFLMMRTKERQAAELVLRAERLDKELARAQLGSLRSQIHPHFLFNALHSIGGLVRAGKEQPALQTLAAMGDLLRATLDHGADAESRLGAEFQITERYLDIEGIRLGDRLEVVLDASENLASAYVPTLLLLPLVENAVLYGVAPRPEGGRVSVSAKRDGSALVIEVSDDGGGFPDSVLHGSSPTQSKGRKCIGLENSRVRLRALYGDEQRFELRNTDDGASVLIVLPYHESPLDIALEGDREGVDA